MDQIDGIIFCIILIIFGMMCLTVAVLTLKWNIEILEYSLIETLKTIEELKLEKKSEKNQTGDKYKFRYENSYRNEKSDRYTNNGYENEGSYIGSTSI